MSASEIDRTLVRLAHEILEKSADLDKLAFIGIRRRGVPLHTFRRRLYQDRDADTPAANPTPRFLSVTVVPHIPGRPRQGDLDDDAERRFPGRNTLARRCMRNQV